MKELIVILGTSTLGIVIFKMMVISGPSGSPSLLSACTRTFTYAIEQFN